MKIYGCDQFNKELTCPKSRQKKRGGAYRERKNSGNTGKRGRDASETQSKSEIHNGR